MRTATIVIRKRDASLANLRKGFLAALKSGKYQGEHFEFESPAALFRTITPKRWELIEALQMAGPLGVRALARKLKRDVKRVHDDARHLAEIGIVEKNKDGKLTVPFTEIRADFVLKSAA